MFIIVVMLAMLLIPLLWLGDKPVRAASEAKKEAVVAQAPVSAPPPAPAAIPAGVHNPEAFGMTWGLLANDKLPSDAVAMSCHGEPRDSISQAHAESCNPYAGDSSCRLALPILCFQQPGIAEGGAAGVLASTAPVAGFVIGSISEANARCERELGTGWRMAEHHDGGGWSLSAKRSAQLDTRLRHWVYINNQPGNCWNNKG